MFTHNVGGVDRILRIVLGAGLLLWFWMDQTTGFWHWAKLGGVLLILNGLLSTCPLYSLLGISSCPVQPRRN